MTDATKVILTIAFVCASSILAFPATATDSAESLDLARQYLALRPGVGLPDAESKVKADDLRLALTALSTDVLRRNGQGPDWNPQNPEWQRFAEIIESDYKQAMQSFAAELNPIEAGKKMDDLSARAVADQFSVQELHELIQFYSGPQGSRLARIQQKMFADAVTTFPNLQAQAAVGQRPTLRPLGSRDPVERQQLAGLFEELWRIESVLLDPGPGGDKSGFQVIPIMVEATLTANYDSYAVPWREIPDQDRQAILDWRKSPMAKREITALSESAKSAKTVMDPRATLQKLMNILEPLEKKWRTLVQSRKK